MKTFQLLSTTIIATALATGAYALPTGGQVTSGTATILTNGNRLDVTQSTAHVDINWKTFSSSTNETINFNQKTSDVAINRVTGGQASVLNGLLTGQGKVVIINDAGLTIGKTGYVNVGALSAYAGGANALIDNQGRIDSRDVSLYANNINNSGTITTYYKNGYFNTPEGSVTFAGNNITNTGTLLTESATVTNADSGILDANGVLTTSNIGTKDTQTDNLGGKIMADQLTITSAKSANYAVLARNTINLSGVVDSNSLVKQLIANGKDINDSSSIYANITLGATHDVNISKDAQMGSAAIVYAGNNLNYNGSANYGNLSLSSGNDINFNGSFAPTYGNNQLNITAGHNLTTGASSSIVNNGLTTTTLKSKADTVLNGKLDVHGLSLTSGGSLTNNGSVSAVYAFLNSGKDTNINGDFHVKGDPVSSTYNYLTFNSNQDINLAGNVTTDIGGITIQAINNVNLNGVLNTHGLNINGNDINFKSRADVKSTGIYAIANNDINLDGKLSTTAGGFQTLRAGHNLNISAESMLLGDKGAETNLNAGKDINFNGTVATDVFHVYAGNDIHEGSIGSLSGSNVDLNANHDISLAGKATATIAKVLVKATNNVLLSDAVLKSPAGVAITGANVTVNGTNVDLSNTTISADRADGTAGKVTVTANGSYKDSSNTVITANGLNGGTISFTNKTGNSDFAGHYSANGDSSKGNGGHIAVASKTLTDTADTTFEANGNTGGIMQINSTGGAAHYKGTYKANGTKTAGSVYLYGTGATTVADAHVETFGNGTPAKHFYYKTGGKVYVINGDGK